MRFFPVGHRIYDRSGTSYSAAAPPITQMDATTRIATSRILTGNMKKIQRPASFKEIGTWPGFDKKSGDWTSSIGWHALHDRTNESYPSPTTGCSFLLHDTWSNDAFCCDRFVRREESVCCRLVLSGIANWRVETRRVGQSKMAITFYIFLSKRRISLWPRLVEKL